MNRTNRFVMAFVVAGVLGTVSQVSASVIAYWDFSSDSNGVTDVTGNFHSLTNSGVSIIDGAAVFNGGPAVFSTVRPLNLSGYTGLTVEFFMRAPAASSAMIMVEQTDAFFFNTGAFVLVHNEAGAAGRVMGGFCCDANGTKLNLDATAADAASGDTWHHVAIVYDPAKAGADRSMLYFDGVAQGTYDTWADGSFNGFCNGTIYLGSRGNAGTRYIGELDDVRISDAALTPGQFLQERTTGAHPVVAYWRFDEGAGLADSSGNNNVLAGSGVVFTNGVARFDGSQPFTFNTAGTLDLTACTSLTVEFFMRTATSPATMVLVEQTVPFFNNPGAFIVDVNDGLNIGGPGRVIGGFCTFNGLNLDMTPESAADDGQWHHVALVYDSSKAGADRSVVYLDGALAQETFATFADGTPTPFLNATLYLGSRNNDNSRYTGELDDVRITGAALVPSQFLKAPSTELPRTIAYWPFSRRQPLADASGNGRALSGAGVTFKDDAAVFDGSQAAFGTLPRTLNLRPYAAVTVECFMRTASAGVGVVLEHSPNFGMFRGGFINLVNEVAAGQFDAGFSMPGGPFNIDSTPAGAVSDGRWHHVALVYDPAVAGDDRVRVYLDGVQQGKREAGWSSDTDMFLLNTPLFIGSRNNAEVRYAGELDDIRITGAALAPSEFLQKRTYYGGTVFAIW